MRQLVGSSTTLPFGFERSPLLGTINVAVKRKIRNKPDHQFIRATLKRLQSIIARFSPGHWMANIVIIDLLGRLKANIVHSN